MRRFFLDASGAALTEFAMAVPLLVVLALGVADYGFLMNNSTVLEASVRSGAEMARANSTTIQASQMTSLFPASANIQTPVMACSCIDGTVVTPCPPTQGTVPCSTAVNPYTGLTDTRVLERISVTATQNFSPIIPWSGLDFPTSLQPTADARIQ